MARRQPGTRCFLCRSADLIPVPFASWPPYSEWVRCRACGSDTAREAYRPGLYGPGWSLAALANAGGPAGAHAAVRGNADWFERAHDQSLPRTFLDVGCGDGAMLDVMQGDGWSVHGWDVTEPHYYGPHVTVTPVFHHAFFPQRYAAVNCREVIEHCPWPEVLLDQLYEACLPGGLVQVQTPVPVDHFDRGVYSEGHLFVASAPVLRAMLADAGLMILDEMHWGEDGRQAGQAYLCRRE